MAHYRLNDGELINSLDDLRYFRVVGELSSFRKAAAVLGVSAQRIKRRIEALEARTGVLLFRRTHNGAMLTAEGARLFDDLADFWHSALIAEKKLSQANHALRGEVVVSVTEGLGTFWLTPRIAELTENNDYLTIFLITDMALGRPELGGCDLAISLDRPNYPDLIVKRLGYLHVMPFASPRYIRKRGAPASLREILKHRVVEQVSEQVPYEKLAEILGGKPEEGFAAIRTNTSAAHFWAVAKGAGIGLLPTYIRAITRKVTPIDMDFRLRRDIWLSFRRDARAVKRIENVISFIEESFDAKRFPWFGEKFLHPDDMENHFRGENARLAFEGFIERDDEPETGANLH